MKWSISHKRTVPWAPYPPGNYGVADYQDRWTLEMGPWQFILALVRRRPWGEFGIACGHFKQSGVAVYVPHMALETGPDNNLTGSEWAILCWKCYIGCLLRITRPMLCVSVKPEFARFWKWPRRWRLSNRAELKR